MIKAIIFDWAGTTVDYGSLAPVIAFKTAFQQAGIDISDQEIRRDMGISKWDHIGKILEISNISQQWEDKYNHLPNMDDREKLYQDFQVCLMDYLKKSTELKPYTLEMVKYLKENGIRYATTTGYTPEMMRVVKDKALELGYHPEIVLTAADVDGQGRPSPKMIQKIMSELEITCPSEVVKVGDTLIDIEEGKNAGVRTIGIVEGSSLMGLSEDEFNKLSELEKDEIRENVVEQFSDVGADMTIDNLSELPIAINYLEHSKEKLTNE